MVSSLLEFSLLTGRPNTHAHAVEVSLSWGVSIVYFHEKYCMRHFFNVLLSIIKNLISSTIFPVSTLQGFLKGIYVFWSSNASSIDQCCSSFSHLNQHIWSCIVFRKFIKSPVRRWGRRKLGK